MNVRDWFPFFGCLLLSSGVWFAASVSRVGSAVESVRVVAVSSIDGYAARSSDAVEVTARCSAPEYALQYLSMREDAPVEVRFSPSDFVKESDGNFSLDASVLQRYSREIFGDNVKAELFHLQKAVFRFEKENARKLPVEPVFHFDFKPQYTLGGDIRLEPDSVLVYGDPEKIALLDRIRTRPVSLDELNRDVRGSAALEMPSGIRLSADVVSYEVPVCRYVEMTATLGINAMNVPGETEMIISPRRARIKAKCRFPLEAGFPDGAFCYVDYDEYVSSSSGKCVVRVAGLPDGVLSYVVEPSTCDCVEKAK